ncbi:MAG: toxin-antitoxin system TumE family protein [Acidobacteriaceae bacterium]
MKADLLIHERVFFEDEFMIEIKVWRVPEPVPPTTHGLKYSLFYGRAGFRIVGYDNERGKGDHCHYKNQEQTYEFTSIEKLLADFKADVEKARGAKI